MEMMSIKATASLKEHTLLSDMDELWLQNVSGAI